MNRAPEVFALETGKASRPAVQVIEPDEEERIFLPDFLSSSGFLGTGSTDPVRGQDDVERAHPELLIRGLPQPAMNGEDLLDRNRKPSPGTPVILTSDRRGPARVEPILRGPGAVLPRDPFLRSARSGPRNGFGETNRTTRRR